MNERHTCIQYTYFNVTATNEKNRDTDVDRTEIENDTSLICVYECETHLHSVYFNVTATKETLMWREKKWKTTTLL